MDGSSAIDKSRDFAYWSSRGGSLSGASTHARAYIGSTNSSNPGVSVTNAQSKYKGLAVRCVIGS